MPSKHLSLKERKLSTHIERIYDAMHKPKSRSSRIHIWLARTLATGQEFTTNQLVNRYNQQYRHGTSVQSLGNILGKSTRVFNQGTHATLGGHKGSWYKTALWSLKKEFMLE